MEHTGKRGSVLPNYLAFKMEVRPLFCPRHTQKGLLLRASTIHRYSLSVNKIGHIMKVTQNIVIYLVVYYKSQAKAADQGD